jgi:monothiol glutaredoxin
MTRLALIAAALVAVMVPTVGALVAPRAVVSRRTTTSLKMSSPSDQDKEDAVKKAIAMMSGQGDGALETPDMVQGRIQALVDQHQVLLFMKGAKSFPQCGFSDTATKVLNSIEDVIEDFGDYHTVDVLSDPMIREGIKLFSQWPTIPQLYVGGEFIGGCDIILELYENGELKELVEQAVQAKA